MFGGSAGLDGRHHDYFQVLDEHRQSQTMLSVWVHPDDPAQAVAFPAPRWDQFWLFALLSAVLAVFGGPILVGALAPSFMDDRTMLLAAGSVALVFAVAVAASWARPLTDFGSPRSSRR